MSTQAYGLPPDPAPEPALVARYALALGDDALVMAQRLAEWVTLAPQLEDDVALANLGLDLLGQARVLLSYAGQLEGAGRDEDDLAYLRDARELTNVRLVELPNGDFAASTARLYAFAVHRRLLLDRLRASTDETLAALAGKAATEVAYHVDYARGWLVRLGDGTEESHARMQAGLEAVWPLVAELFAPVDAFAPLVAAGVAVDERSLRPAWDAEVDAVLAEATLARPDEPGPGGPSTHESDAHESDAQGPSPREPSPDEPAPPRGRLGEHTEHLAPLLATLQEVHRAHQGASW